MIVGGAGRMARALIACTPEFAPLRVGAVIASAHSATVGQDAGEMAGQPRLGVPIATDLGAALHDAHVVIDFSSPRAARDHIDQCALARVPILIGTTGLPDGFDHDIARAAERISVLVAPNTSLGVTLLTELVQRAARALPAEFDIEVFEAHHRSKKDAPSGTALALGEAAVRGRDLPRSALSGARHAQSTRTGNEIGFAVLRGGDIVGEHEVRFAGPGEQLLLAHRASDRSIFARGALRAAAWLIGQRPGRYAMSDVLGINSVS